MIATKIAAIALGGFRVLSALKTFTIHSWRAAGPWIAFAAAVAVIVVAMDKILKATTGFGLADQLKALPEFLGFQTGGIVPGPIGSPQTAIVHGGEEIKPVVASEGLGGGGGITLNVNIGTFIGSENDKRNLAEAIMKHMENIATMQGKKLRIIE